MQLEIGKKYLITPKPFVATLTGCYEDKVNDVPTLLFSNDVYLQGIEVDAIESVDGTAVIQGISASGAVSL
jgi:hypothetical protein